ncbi:MAG: Peptidase M22 glycoprotease [Candidatus Tokpelaia sp. JSC188]|nr:MAG: Peptidase M22 glycoprotease [Candidatus Tokpelaia sp. JSC188]
MLILAIDTASPFCATGLINNNRLLAKVNKSIGKRHAECLMEQIMSVMDEAHKNFSDIDRISVNTGPGSFTGVRVGVSAARGLALALDRPAIGINTFEALAFETAQHYKDRPITIVLEAHRGTLYVQDFNAKNQAIRFPRIDTAEAIAATLSKTTLLRGSGVYKITQRTCHPFFDTTSTADIEIYAFLAARKKKSEKANPLYMHPPDVKPKAAIPFLPFSGEINCCKQGKVLSEKHKCP